MAGSYILAHDLGTTGNKACLYDLDEIIVISKNQTVSLREASFV